MAIQSFHDACKAVIRECPNGYAKAYAREGLNLLTTNEQQTQGLYILSNIQQWHSPNAQRVRIFLKEFTQNANG